MNVKVKLFQPPDFRFGTATDRGKQHYVINEELTFCGREVPPEWMESESPLNVCDRCSQHIRIGQRRINGA